MSRQIPFGRLAAEFVVIVVGVLVALAADAWWDGRQVADLEDAQLRSIRADAEVAIAAIDFAIEQERRSAHSAEQLLQVSSEAPTDSIDLWLRWALYRTADHFIPFAAYNDLINAGQLELITDAEVRRSLLEIQRQLDRLYSFQQDVAATQVAHIDGLMLRQFDLPSINDPFIEGPSPLHASLLTDREVINALSFKGQRSNGVAFRFGNLRGQFTDLIAQVDEAVRR